MQEINVLDHSTIDKIAAVAVAAVVDMAAAVADRVAPAAHVADRSAVKRS